MNRAQCAIIIFFKDKTIALIKELRNKKKRLKTRNYRTLKHRHYCDFRKEKVENAKLSNIEASLNIMIYYYNSTL